MGIIRRVELESIKSSPEENLNEELRDIDDYNNQGCILYGIFMELFKTIEVNLGALYDKVFEKAYGLSCLQSLSITYIPPTKRHLSISRLVKTLIDAKAVPEGLGPEIITLIKYRNALVHTNDVDPSQHMVRNAQIVNEEIKRLLEEY